MMWRGSGPRAAFTLVEVMIGAAVASSVLAALAIGSITLQRTFAAVEGFGTAQSDQMRTLDYITRDVRRAKSLTITTSPTVLTLTVPNYIDSSTGLPLTPSLSGGVISYGTTTITYSLSGSNLVRDQSGNRLVVARTVTAFAPVLDPADAKQKTVTVSLTFASPLKWRSTAQTGTSVTMQAKATARN